MKPSGLTEDERNELIVLQLLELMQRFGNPLKRPAKVIPWSKPSGEAVAPDKKKP